MGMDEWLDKYPPVDKDKDTEPLNKILPVSRKKLLKQQPQSKIDLHGLTADEARKAVEDFLLKSKKRGLKKVLIIHGKGYHSDGKPVLKREVYSILERTSLCGEFGKADPKNGGSGAVWVMLK
ncbi:MAG: Smr/MutS family protein [Spirochaetales bacterium]|nr:Smr/MutS family protein [Spirochaetales bacterium]